MECQDSQNMTNMHKQHNSLSSTGEDIDTATTQIRSDFTKINQPGRDVVVPEKSHNIIIPLVQNYCLI